MKLYYRTSSAGKCGCRRTSNWRVTEDYKNKTALRKHYQYTGTRVECVLTEEQASEEIKAMAY